MRNKPRPGRSAEELTPTMVANDVNQDRRVTLLEVPNQFGIGKVSAHQILYEKIGICKVSARWVPKQLTEDQTAFRAKEHLGRLNYHKNTFLSCIVAKEIWVHFAEPETKAHQSIRRVGSPPPKKFKLS